MNKRIKKKFKKRFNLRHYPTRKNLKNGDRLFDVLIQNTAYTPRVPVSLLRRSLKDENYTSQLQFLIHYKK